MSTTTTRKFKIGDEVWINIGVEHDGVRSIRGTVVGHDAHSFCGTCHCGQGCSDGSMCCPGPSYAVSYDCPDGNDHRHEWEAFAEHELSHERR